MNHAPHHSDLLPAAPRWQPRKLSLTQRRLLTVLLSGALLVLGLLFIRFPLFLTTGQMLLVVATAVAGYDIAVRAVRSLASRTIGVELLVTIAATGALLIGEYWEAAAVTFLFTFGAWLEARTLQSTRRALGELLELAPEVAVVLRDGQPLEVSPWEVVAGETVLVRPGSRLAVDGWVIEGSSTVDQSPITGEPLPVTKQEGDEVFAGTVNQNGLLQVRATQVGADTTLARIIQRVEAAQEAKAPTQRFIERFAARYTPAMLLLAGIVWLLTQDLHLALTLLVISCPGALVISTPVSIVAGIGRAARKGILIKGGEHLERAGRIDTVAFDKTGTLTQGEPVLSTVVTLGDADRLDLIRTAASAELASEHPLAAPIRAAADGQLHFPEQFESVTGRGISATVAGSRVLVGSLRFMEESGIQVDRSVRQSLDDMQEQGQTAVAVARDGQLLGLLGIEDQIRGDAAAAIAELQRMGIRSTVMLTGDGSRTARAVAQAAGIDRVEAELLPEDKLEKIHELQDAGAVVAMVGDGINDAPALAAADVGVAMGAAGTDVAIETADIALLADELGRLPEAIRLSRLTLRNIRQNTGLALLTVAGLLAGVLLGQVHMAGGMLIHQLSVFLVILNAMRLMRA